MLIDAMLNKLKLLPLTAITALGLVACSDAKLTSEQIDKLYAVPLAKPTKPLTLYHLGHSLVGRDMPAMLKQLAGDGHDYRTQLGWGTSLRDHINPEFAINGFEEENNHPFYQDYSEAIKSKTFDAFVFTEMVDIQDAIKYFDSANYITQLIQQIQQHSPDTNMYLYESWYELTDPKGWVNRLDEDLEKYWLGGLLDKALAKLETPAPVYVIPVGQVLSAFFKAVGQRGGVEGISQPEDIFARTDTGELDPIHMNDVGMYLVALVHYAVLYQESPEGKPFRLLKATGEPAVAPSQEAAELMQTITWQVVSQFQRSGMAQAQLPGPPQKPDTQYHTDQDR